MSMEALRWAQSLTEKDAPGLKGPRKSVLNTIASHQNKDNGQCRLKWGTIAAEAGIGVSTAEQAGKWLRKQGFLSWDVWRRDDGRFGAIDFIIHREPPVGATEQEPTTGTHGRTHSL